MTKTPIRSVLLETRTYRDSAGNPNTGALLCLNGRLVAAFALHYGAPAITEEYHAAPYLEAVGVLSENDRHRALGNRIRALGADYYLTEAVMKRRDCFRHSHALEASELWSELEHEAARFARIYGEISEGPAKDLNSGGVKIGRV